MVKGTGNYKKDLLIQESRETAKNSDFITLEPIIPGELIQTKFTAKVFWLNNFEATERLSQQYPFLRPALFSTSARAIHAHL